MTTANQKEMVGRVVSNKMQKTVVVAVDKLRHHRLYKRAMRVTRKYYAHDESDSLNIGDTVRIVETRPLSKLKRWRVAEVMRHAVGLPQVADPVVEEVAESAPERVSPPPQPEPEPAAEAATEATAEAAPEAKPKTTRRRAKPAAEVTAEEGDE